MKALSAWAFSSVLQCAAFGVCLNGHPTIEKEFHQRPVVVTAKVLSSAGEIPAMDKADALEYFTIRVLKSYKGETKGRLRFFNEVNSGRFPVDVGQTYLLFLVSDKRGWFVDSCGNSGELGHSTATLRKVAHLSGRSIR